VLPLLATAPVMLPPLSVTLVIVGALGAVVSITSVWLGVLALLIPSEFTAEAVTVLLPLALRLRLLPLV
jgi:hypothetical protein